MEEKNKKTTAGKKTTANSTKKKTTAANKKTTSTKKVGATKSTTAKSTTAKKKTTTTKKTTGAKKQPTKKVMPKKEAPKASVVTDVEVVEEFTLNQNQPKKEVPKVRKPLTSSADIDKDTIISSTVEKEVPIKPENKRLRNLLLVVVFLVLFILVGTTAQQNKEKALISINVDQYIEKLKGSEKSIIYVGRPDCTYCKKLKPGLLNTLNDQKIKAYYFNVDTIDSQEAYDTYVNSDEKVKENSGTTPLVMVVQDGKVIDLIVGYKNEKEVKKFIDSTYKTDGKDNQKEEEKPKEETKDEDKKDVGIIDTDVSKYMELLKSSDSNIIYLGRPTCSYCVKLKPHLEKIAKENNLAVHYVNIDKITSEEDINTFYHSTDAFDENNLATPLVLITKDGKVKDSNKGYVEKDKLESFFEKNDIIK